MAKGYLQELEYYKSQNWYPLFKANFKTITLIHNNLYETYKEAKRKNATILQCSFVWFNSTQNYDYWQAINKAIADKFDRTTL